MNDNRQTYFEQLIEIYKNYMTIKEKTELLEFCFIDNEVAYEGEKNK